MSNAQELPLDKLTVTDDQETVREYFQDTFRTESKATVVRVDSSPDYTKVPGAVDVQLDRTIFFPQCGGQPTDTGVIQLGDRTFKVIFVQADGHTGGVVHHYGTFDGEAFAPGEEVSLAVDAEKRVLHAKLHTAHHLLCVAMDLAGYGHFAVGKPYSFPESAYGEYHGKIPPEDRKDAIVKLQAAMDKLIKADITVVKSMADGVQTVVFGKKDDYPPAEYQTCGGTHLDSTGQIGRVIIRKLKVKKGLTRVYYALAE